MAVGRSGWNIYVNGVKPAAFTEPILWEPNNILDRDKVHPEGSLKSVIDSSHLVVLGGVL